MSKLKKAKPLNICGFAVMPEGWLRAEKKDRKRTKKKGKK